MIVTAGHGTRFEVTDGERMQWKATADETRGAIDVFEVTLAAGSSGPPEHIHDAVDELFYILDGQMIVSLDGEETQAGAGTFVFVPRGTRHAWVNAGDSTARFLTLFTPGGMRAFFEDTAPLLQARPLDVPALAAAAARHSTRVTGPPLAPAARR